MIRTGKDPSATWVAIDDRRRMIGFADVGPSRDTDPVGRIGEVRAIYVLEGTTEPVASMSVTAGGWRAP